jgi:competence protein ComGC
MKDDKVKFNHKINAIWLILILMVIENFILLFILLNERSYIEVKIDKEVNSSVVAEVEKKITSLNISDKIESTDIDSLIQDTVIREVSKIPVTNGKDGLDGTNGIDGVDGVDGINGLDGHNGIDGINGLTPILVCNTEKNRWEATYDGGITYRIILDRNNKPVRCVASVL